jgi:hypothetical protein
MALDLAVVAGAQPVNNRVALRLKPFQSRVFDDRFGEDAKRCWFALKKPTSENYKVFSLGTTDEEFSI